MSILIKGAEMPVSCAGCPCANDESRYCYAAGKYVPMLGKPDFCPLAEVEEPPTGKWEDRSILEDSKAIDVWQSALCSNCRRYHTTPYLYSFKHYDFCPHCGARMEGK